MSNNQNDKDCLFDRMDIAESEIKNLNIEIASIKQKILFLENDMSEVKKDIKDIKERLLNRPSWFVTIIITLLSTFAFSCLTFTLSILKTMIK